MFRLFCLFDFFLFICLLVRPKWAPSTKYKSLYSSKAANAFQSPKLCVAGNRFVKWRQQMSKRIKIEFFLRRKTLFCSESHHQQRIGIHTNLCFACCLFVSSASYFLNVKFRITTQLYQSHWVLEKSYTNYVWTAIKYSESKSRTEKNVSVRVQSARFTFRRYVYTYMYCIVAFIFNRSVRSLVFSTHFSVCTWNIRSGEDPPIRWLIRSERDEVNVIHWIMKLMRIWRSGKNNNKRFLLGWLKVRIFSWGRSHSPATTMMTTATMTTLFITFSHSHIRFVQ